MITTRRHNLTQIPWQAVVAAAALLPTVGVLAARSVLPPSGPRAASAAPSVDSKWHYFDSIKQCRPTERTRCILS